MLVHLKEKRFSPEQAMRAALQIYHVVEHFPRFLSAILTQIPDYRLRMPLVENLFEEHGRMNVQRVHLETYKQFLSGIGVTPEHLAASEPIIPVIAYNRAVTDLCLHYPYSEGLAALGVIEEIVARVSPLVGSYASTEYGDSTDLLILPTTRRWMSPMPMKSTKWSLRCMKAIKHSSNKGCVWACTTIPASIQIFWSTPFHRKITTSFIFLSIF